MIPRRDIVFAALAESAAAYEVHDQPWASRWKEIDLTAARRLAVNQING